MVKISPSQEYPVRDAEDDAATVLLALLREERLGGGGRGERGVGGRGPMIRVPYERPMRASQLFLPTHSKRTAG